MATELHREMGEISRASEFFSVSELTAQTGQAKENFASVVVKELLDNAIDAAESGALPEVSLEITLDDQFVRIVVSDNGPGFKSEDIERITNFDVRVSDKLFYRSPSRGQQGNALKTVLGMPFALGSTAPVIIRSQGIEHRIYAAPDPLGKIHVAHTQIKIKIDGSKGTVIEVTLPRNPATRSFNPRGWAQAYALANPHVLIQFHMSYPDKLDSSKIVEISDLFQPTCQISKQWHKFMVKDLTAPSWYDVATFEQNLFVNKEAHPVMTLRDYVKTFRGLSHNDKAKAVCDQFPAIKHLNDFENQDSRVAALLKAMKETAEPPSPKVLGMIGKDHFKAKFDEWYGIKGKLNYKRSDPDLIVDGIPYVIEAARAEVNSDRGQIFSLVNFGAAFDDPIPNTLLEVGTFHAYGFKSFMLACHASPVASDQGARQNVAIALHIASPKLAILDRGKTHVEIPLAVATEIAKCLWSVGKKFYVEGEAFRRDFERESKRLARLERERQTHVKEPSLKKAIYAVLHDAYLLKSGNEQYDLSCRDLYYGVRDFIQPQTSDELTYEYFKPKVPEYEREYGKLEKLYYDPRGFMIEPDGKTTQLGTREVRGYEFPLYKYNKILCVEKKGFVQPFIQEQIHQRYDMAICAGEGFASTALRDLLEKADRDTDYKIFVLHDADASGYDIARTMREETDRMPGYHVDIIDLGLRLEEALFDLGLKTEAYTRRKALSKKLIPQLTPLELEYFTGKSQGRIGKVGKKGIRKEEWKCQRIELNAMSPIDRITWLERKLAEHGATTKVCPPDEILNRRAAITFEAKFREKTREKLIKQLKIDEIVDKAVAEMEIPDWSDTIDDLKDALESNPPMNWSEILDNLVTAEAEMGA